MEAVGVKRKSNLEAVWTGGKKGESKVAITSLNSHLSEIYSDTKYGFLSMRTKRNPHCPMAVGIRERRS
jgi:hypothetical protein